MYEYPLIAISAASRTRFDAPVDAVVVRSDHEFMVSPALRLLHHAR